VAETETESASTWTITFRTLPTVCLGKSPPLFLRREEAEKSPPSSLLATFSARAGLVEWRGASDTGAPAGERVRTCVRARVSLSQRRKRARQLPFDRRRVRREIHFPASET